MEASMREELFRELVYLLQGFELNENTLKSRITMILDRYEIMPRETAVAVLDEVTNENLLKKFIIAKAVEGCSARTVEYYTLCCKQIMQQIGKNLRDITADDIRLYMALRHQRDGVTSTTVNNEIRCMSSFFTWLLNEEFIDKNPMAKIQRMKEEKKQRKAFSDMEVELLRSACRDNRERAIIEVLLSTGCRVSEFCHIRISDIEEGSLVVRGKGDKDRRVYLNAKATVAIQQYLAERRDENPYLFPKGIGITKTDRHGVSQKDMHEWYKNPVYVDPNNCPIISSIEANVRKIGRRAGVKNTHPHRFRRTCATFALRRGMPIEQVSKMLGHEQLNTTKIYLDLDEKDLEAAHRKYVY